MLLLANSDAALVRKALDDRHGAFEELVRRYQKKAHAIAWAIGVPGDSVDDVVQDAFLKAFENLPHLRSPESFGPWLLNIARNAARSFVQDLRRRAPPELAGGPGGCDAPALERQELREVVWRKVAELPEGVREAVFLYYHEGESVRAVAKTLGTTRAAALKRLERGRKLLREKLWRSLEDSIREMIPSAREWRRKGRQLAVLLIGAVATSWGIRAAPVAAAGGAGGVATGSGWLFKLLAGGIDMAAKKQGIAIGLAFLMIAGGLYVFLDPFRGREPNAGAGPAVSIAPRAAPGSAGAAAGTGRRVETAAAADANAGQPAAFVKPPSILGLVKGASGNGIGGARLMVLPVREWDGIVSRAAADLADDRDGDLTGKLRAAAREFRGRAADLAGAESDADGAYRFHDLPDGEYRVICGHEAHLPRTDGWAQVRPGEPFRLDLELAGAAAIAGIVVDESGQPVPDAVVAARRSSDRVVDPRWKKDRILADWAEGKPLLAAGQAVSGKEGTFRLGALASLPHDLRVEKEGYALARLLDVSTGEEAVEVILSRGLAIRGRLLDPRMQPLEGAEALLVTLGPERPRPAPVNQTGDRDVPADHDQAGSRRASSDSGGRFEFTGLSAGFHEVRVSRRGFPVKRQEVHLEASAADLGDLILEASRAIAGRVRDSRGAPLPGARVWIEGPVAGGVAVRGSYGRSDEPPILAETQAGADGSFLIDDLSEGVYAVRASSRNQAPACLPAVAAGGDPVEIRLEDGATLEGVVLDALGGHPVAGAEVIPGGGFFPDPEKRTLSGPDGTFTIQGIAYDDRKISLRVTHGDYPWQPGETRWDAGQLGQTVEVLLYPAERIEGTVRDAAGNPVAGARVSYEVPGWERVFVLRVMGGLRGSARSGGDGSFAVEAPSLLRGIRFPNDRTALELIASHPSLGIGRSGLFDAPAKGESWPRVEVVLVGTSSLEGKVTDERGEPVAGAVVLAARKASREDGHALDRGPVLTGSSDSSGAYAITGLEPGEFQVEARAQGRPRTIIDRVEVGAESRVLDVALEAGTALQGLVVDDAGLAVAAAEVSAREGSTVIASASTDEGGRWRLEDLPERELTLVARAPRHGTSEPRLVRPGESPAALVLMRLADLSGAVVDSSSGMPVSSFTVLVRFEPATASSASGAEGELVPREFIDPRGSFHLDGLLPGSCVVAVRARGFAVWAREVMLAPGEEATVHALLERGSTLRGAVVDRETGLAIPNARVQWSGGGRRPDDQLASRFQLLEAAREWTDAGGQFVLSGLVPGEYSVSACHSGYLPDGDRGRVAIGEAGPEFLELGMRPASGLQGKIGNLEGKWSIALMLVLKRTEGEFGGDRWCHLEQDGRFQFTSLPPGTYRVELGTYQSDPKPEIVRLGEPLGEIVVRAGETATFDAPAP